MTSRGVGDGVGPEGADGAGVPIERGTFGGMPCGPPIGPSVGMGGNHSDSSISDVGNPDAPGSCSSSV